MTERDDTSLLSEQVDGSADQDTVEIEGITVDTSTVGQSDDFPDEDRTDVDVSAQDADVDHSKPS